MKINTDFAIPVDEEITLELFEIDDAEELFRIVERNREHLCTYLGWLDKTKSVDNARFFIESNLPPSLQLQSLNLAIKKNGIIIGSVALHQIDYINKSTALGYWLDKDHCGQGIMGKSVKALIDYSFTVLKLHRLEIRCAVHNDASLKLARRLGFQKVGVLQEAIYHYGIYHDAHHLELINRND